jgi:hypothetical protein
MGYMLSESVVPETLTPGRLEWLKHVLTKYGVSAAGAEQFTRLLPVTNPSDRQQLLDILNRVVVTAS